MWLIEQIGLRQLTRERVRTVVTTAGIAIGVAVIVAIRLANASSLRGFETALAATTGETGLEIVASGGIDETWLPALDGLRDVGVTSPVVEGQLLVLDSHDADESEEGSAAVGTRRRRGEMLRVLGVDILRDRGVRTYSFFDAAGSRPTIDVLRLLREPDAIVVTARFASARGLKVGDSFRAVVGPRRSFARARAAADPEGLGSAFDGGIAVMDLAAAQWMFGRLGRVDRVDVRLHDPHAIDAVERAVAQQLPAGLTVQRPARRGAQVEHMLAAFHANLTALSYVALLVGLFLVYNTVSTSVITRRQEIGMLRAVGVTRRAVLGLFLAEAVGVAIPGCALGVLVGRLLANGAVALTSTTVQSLYVAVAAAPPALRPADVLLAFAVGVPLSAVAAILPALEAARTPAIDAIRPLVSTEARTTMGRWRGVIISGVLALVGVWLARWPAVSGVPLAGYGAAVAFVFAGAFLVPRVLTLVVRIGGAPIERICGISGTLALANLRGAISRVSISVAALSVSLSMMVAIALMVGSFRDTVGYWVGQTLQADIYLAPAGGGSGSSVLSPEVQAIVAASPAVTAVDAVHRTSLVVDDVPMAVVVSDFAAVVERGGLQFKAPRRGAAAAVRAARGADAVVVSEAFSLKHHRQVGDTVLLPTRDGVRPFTIAAIAFDYSSDRGVISIDRRTFHRHFGDDPPTGLSIHVRDDADAEQVRSDLARALGTHRVFLRTTRALRAEVLRIFDSTFAITYALEVIAIAVAMLGIAGTVLTLVLERRHELATVRIVGGDRAQLRGMVLTEAALLGVVSQIIGLVVGAALSVVLIYVINVQSFGWTIQFHVPVMFLVQMSLAVPAAAVLAGVYPARRAARLPLVQRGAE